MNKKINFIVRLTDKNNLSFYSLKNTATNENLIKLGKAINSLQEGNISKFEKRVIEEL